MITLQEQRDYILSKGWSTWYNPDYWVHKKTISDSCRQDYTGYGMDLNSAYCFEILNLPPFSCMGVPVLGQTIQAFQNRDRIEELLKTLEISE